MMKYCRQICFVCLLVLNVVLAAYYLSQKQGWHIDEQYSYGHANSTQGAFLSNDIDSYFQKEKTDLHERWLSNDVFHDYLTVQENERFVYQHIWHNLKSSVHPPLFYVIVHTVCSFTPDVFTRWQVGSINLIAFMLALIVLYKLSRLFIKDDYLAMVPVFLWGFSEAGLSTILYLRMYMLQTLLGLCLLYEVCLLLQKNYVDKKVLFLIFLYSALGILTQYSSIIFSFITAAVVCVILLLRNNWKLLFYFSLSMLLSVVALFVIFPQALEVLLFSSRGQEVLQKSSEIDLWSLGTAIMYSRTHTQVFSIYFSKLFGFSPVYDFVLFVFFVISLVVLKLQKKSINAGMILIFLIILFMTIYLALFMPDSKVLFEWRYYMILMPVVSLFLCWYGISVLHIIGINTNIKILIAGILSLICVLKVNVFSAPFDFRFPITDDTRQLIQQLKNKKIVVIAPSYLFFDTTYLFKDAEAVRWEYDVNNMSCDISGTYLMLNRGYVKHISEDVKINAELAEQLEFLARFRSGFAIFDLYKVKY